MDITRYDLISGQQWSKLTCYRDECDYELTPSSGPALDAPRELLRDSALVADPPILDPQHCKGPADPSKLYKGWKKNRALSSS
jgi:hypothetical protein